MEVISQERLATSEPTGITFRKIIVSIRESTKNDQKFKPKRRIAIVGDLMFKNIYGPSHSDNKSNVFVKSISGAKTKCMKSYLIPTVELEPDAIVIHCGTNNLRRQEQPEELFMK